MLHITLAILKIIGIILLVLILLVTAVLFAVMFVPLRYRIQAVYTDEQMRGELRLTWLLHLISVRLAMAEDTSSAEKDMTDSEEPDSDRTAAGISSSGLDRQAFSRFAHIQPYSEVRILGIKVESFLSFFGKIRSKRRSHEARGRSAGRGVARRRTPKKQIPEKQTNKRQTQEKHTTDNHTESMSDSRENGKRQAEASDGAKNHEELFKVKADKETNKGTKAVKEANEKAKAGKVTDEEEKTGEEAARKVTAKDEADSENGLFRKPGNLLYKLSRICDKIKQMPLLLKRLYGQIKELLSKPGQIKERVAGFLRKMEKYQASEVLSEVWSELKRLFHHYRVRDGSGYIRFGTGDPALTGEITGALYLIFPASCGDISIEPQFTQAMFETELQIRGHIRIVHMLRTAWWGFRNKKLRRLIRAFQ